MKENPDTAPELAQPEAEKPFMIDCEEHAVWYCKKRRAIADEMKAIKEATAQRLEELAADERSLMGRFEEQLKSWAMGEKVKRRRETVTLPLAGVALCFRTPKTGKLVETAEGLQMRRDIATSMGFMTEEQVIPAQTIPAEPDLERLLAYATEQYSATPEGEEPVIISGYEWKDPEASFKIDFNPNKGKATVE